MCGWELSGESMLPFVSETTAGARQIIIPMKVEQEKGRLLHVRDKGERKSCGLIYALVY